MNTTCGKCGGHLESGFTTAIGLIGGTKRENQDARLIFVVPGRKTSMNPIQAIQQGLSDEPSDRSYKITGSRCSQCGALELYAVDRSAD
jgi:hypothetical protein